MKDVVLINNSYLENLSVRYLGSYLKARGYRVTTIHYEGRKEDVFNLLTEKSLQTLARHCLDTRLVGISLLTTHQLDRSRQIHEYLRHRIKAKIIWGGVPSIILENTYSDEQFESYMVNLFHTIGSGRAFILGVADNVMPGAKIERLRRITHMVDELG